MIFAFSNITAQTHHFKFKVENKEKLNTLTKIISIDNYKDGYVWAYANNKEFNEFSKLKYTIEELPLRDNNAKATLMADTLAEMANWDRYPTYEVYIEMMNKFATDYPDICKIINIDTTVNGRELLALKISDNVNTNEAEPEFFYTSTMHGDETTGFVLLLRLADSILSNYVVVKDINNIVNNFEIYINPNANPDGTYAGGNSTVSGATRYNANNEDINRDFPDPINGEVPPYEQETQAMMNFAGQHHFVMSVNFHGGIEVVNYPWDVWTTTVNAPADADWFIKTGTDYVNTARTINPNYMTSYNSTGVTEGGDWYVIYGGRQDYMNYWHHCKEVTMEISDFKLLPTDSLHNFWNYNKQSLFDYIEEAGYGFNGTVTNINSDPLDAKIEISGYDKDNSWVVTDPANGDYYRPIAPGTYDVTYSSPGYISQTHTVTVTDWKTTTIKNVILGTTTEVSPVNSFMANVFPNPFKDKTTFSFYLNKKSDVNLFIYSYTGKLIKQLNYQNLDTGKHEITWDNLNNTKTKIPSGIYFYKIQSETQSYTNKIIISK